MALFELVSLSNGASLETHLKYRPDAHNLIGSGIVAEEFLLLSPHHYKFPELLVFVLFPLAGQLKWIKTAL